ncbi:MAG TPA: GTP cyclohydrolase II [Hyphomicrobiaceae bacterium]|jgi:GTP cyclohydrolase II/3,4-dihydroxy 2-butanone 4-phosphate synthase/GTP cyclohydrolase II|nr:MAG: peptide ABC transporter substrate-binding protein [Pseudomonadota bacterium]HEX5599448.1 GTP cyclohydrolase II [Hyphomicrobiaceae bacterium]
MANGSDAVLGVTRDATTASDAQSENISARAPWHERHPLNGQANGARSNGAGIASRELQAQDDAAPVFRDRARTILPVEYQGREVVFEAYAYEDDSASYQALALVHRATSSSADELPLVRVHSGCATGDIFHSLRCDCHAQLQKAIGRVIESRIGAIIYLPHHEGRGIGLVAKIKAYAEQDRGLDTVDANISIGAPVDARDYTLAAKILKDLGFTEIRLLTNNPLKVEALQRLGIKVAEQIQHATSPSRYNARYLATKRERMAHKL